VGFPFPTFRENTVLIQSSDNPTRHLHTLAAKISWFLIFRQVYSANKKLARLENTYSYVRNGPHIGSQGTYSISPKQRKLDVIKFGNNKVGNKLIKITFQLYGFVRYLTIFLNQPHYYT